MEYRMQLFPNIYEFACVDPLITLCQFANWAQITCGAVAKGDWLPF
jgi:hypothetical protein